MPGLAPKCTEKNSGFVPFWLNLTHIGPKSDIAVTTQHTAQQLHVLLIRLGLNEALKNWRSIINTLIITQPDSNERSITLGELYNMQYRG